MFKLTKEHEGQEFWCVPTQNNVRRGRGTDALLQAEMLKVIDIKRLYCNIGYGKYRLADYGQTETRAQYNNNANGGYIVFSSSESFEKYKKRLTGEVVIKSKLSGCGSLDLTDDQVNSIVDIINQGE